jgi:hypothetical protein
MISLLYSPILSAFSRKCPLEYFNGIIMENNHNQTEKSNASIDGGPGPGSIPVAVSGFEDPVGLMSDFVNILMNIQDYNFILNDKDIEPQQLSNPSELLGVVLWHAEKRVRLAYTGDESVAHDGATLNVYFVQDPEAVLGVRPVIGELTQRSPLPCFVVDIIEETFKHNLVSRNTASLDGLLQSFREDYEAGLIPQMDAEAPRFPEPGLAG